MSKEIYLEIEAGSSGRPNQAQQLQNFERLAPILMQLPGVKPQFLAKEAIRRMDDKHRRRRGGRRGLAKSSQR